MVLCIQQERNELRRVCSQNNDDDDAEKTVIVQGGSNMTGTDLSVNKLHCAAAVRP